MEILQIKNGFEPVRGFADLTTNPDIGLIVSGTILASLLAVLVCAVAIWADNKTQG